MDSDAQAAAAAGIGMGFLIVLLAIIVFSIIVHWKIYTKAGQPGWACIIPIYNIIVWLQIVGRPIWWIILLLIPLVNIIIFIVIIIDLAKSFGKGAGFGVGMFLVTLFIGIPIFQAILAFGDAQYQGPSAAQS